MIGYIFIPAASLFLTSLFPFFPFLWVKMHCVDAQQYTLPPPVVTSITQPSPSLPRRACCAAPPAPQRTSLCGGNV